MSALARAELGRDFVKSIRSLPRDVPGRGANRPGPAIPTLARFRCGISERTSRTDITSL